MKFIAITLTAAVLSGTAGYLYGHWTGRLEGAREVSAYMRGEK